MSQQTIRQRPTACGDIKREHEKNRDEDRPFLCLVTRHGSIRTSVLRDNKDVESKANAVRLTQDHERLVCS